jgi:hypothetical protein
VSRLGALRANGDRGSAVVEFVTLGVLLLVPVVYLVVTLGRVQAGAFAVEGAAREAARAFSSAPDEEAGVARARAGVLLALGDQGFEDVDPAAALTLTCESEPCLQAEARVTATVAVDVVLPGVPAFVDAVVPTRVPVRAQAVAVVDRFRG